MTIDDYYRQSSSTGTVHLARRKEGPALCGFGFDGRGRLVLDRGVDADALCGTCAAEVR